MNLLLVRHAIAEDVSPTGQDSDRPLSPEGRDRFKQTCKKLVHLKLEFDLLLDSPLLRSQQTADIFCKYFSVQKRETSTALQPLATASDLLMELSAHSVDSAVIFGHQPFLTKFINHCVTEDKRVFTLLKRGGMAFLEFPLSVKAGGAVLKALLAPKYLLNDS